MNYLEQAKQKLAEYKERKKEFLSKLNVIYDEEKFYEDESALENAIGDDFILDWMEQRDYVYISDVILSQERLIDALETLEKKERESFHDGKEVLENLVQTTQILKKQNGRGSKGAVRC